MRGLRRSLTARGRWFAGAGTLLLILGTVLGLRDLSRIGVLLLALTAGSLFLSRRHGLQLTVERELRPGRVTVDQPSTVTVHIRNPEGIRSPLLLAEERLDFALGDRPRFVVPSLRGRQSCELQYTVTPNTRGVHRVGPLAVRVKDPFGLTLRAVSLSGAGELVALPQVHALPGGRSLGSGLGADGSVPHMVALAGEDDQTVREYRDGDDLRRIHWPATARTGELMVRQEDRPTRRRAVILVDSRPGTGGAGRTGALEWTVTMAASVAAHLLDDGYAVHLLTADEATAGAVRVDDDLDGALDALARLQLGSTDSWPGVIHAASALTASGGLVLAVTGGMTDDEARSLGSLRQPGSTGLALVVDARSGPVPEGGGFLEGHSDEAATVAALGLAGWRALVVSPYEAHASAWSRAHLGALARSR